MFSMSLRLWAGSMSFSRLDQGNLFQQRAQGSERPCHVVIRQQAHTGKREGWIQISDQRSCPSKRSWLRLLQQTSVLAPCRSCLPSSCPTALPESTLLIGIIQPGCCAASLAHGDATPVKESPAGEAALRRWQEVIRLSPAPAWQCQRPPGVRQHLPPCRIRGEQRGGGRDCGSSCPCGCPGAAPSSTGRRGCARAVPEGTMRSVSIHIHQQQLLAARSCCARLCHARLCPAVPSRAQRGEQSLSKAPSPPCCTRHHLVCILCTPPLNNFGVIFSFLALGCREVAGVGLRPSWVPTPWQAVPCSCPFPPHTRSQQDPWMGTPSLASIGSEHGHSEGFFPPPQFLFYCQTGA